MAGIKSTKVQSFVVAYSCMCGVAFNLDPMTDWALPVELDTGREGGWIDRPRCNSLVFVRRIPRSSRRIRGDSRGTSCLRKESVRSGQGLEKRFPRRRTEPELDCWDLQDDVVPHPPPFLVRHLDARIHEDARRAFFRGVYAVQIVAEKDYNEKRRSPSASSACLTCRNNTQE